MQKPFDAEGHEVIGPGALGSGIVRAADVEIVLVGKFLTALASGGRVAAVLNDPTGSQQV